jgi:hypothetical protein
MPLRGPRLRRTECTDPSMKMGYHVLHALQYTHEEDTGGQRLFSVGIINFPAALVVSGRKIFAQSAEHSTI